MPAPGGGSHFAVAIAIVVLLAIVSVLSRWAANDKRRHTTHSAHALRQLVDQAIKWWQRSRQDTDPVLRTMHANYAVAYASAARELGSEDEIRQLGLHYEPLTRKILDAQGDSIKHLALLCPGEDYGEVEEDGYDNYSDYYYDEKQESSPSPSIQSRVADAGSVSEDSTSASGYAVGAEDPYQERASDATEGYYGRQADTSAGDYASAPLFVTT